MPVQPLTARPLKTALRLADRLRLPKLDGALRLAGLSAAVEVLRDARGLPHIYAQNAHDLFFAQGFVHCQDRMWQMEAMRRMAAGRLAEALGPQALPFDRWMRTLTLRRVAEYEVGLLDEIPRAHLQAYANGVNACLARGRLPLEFSLLRLRPEPWTPADTLSWIKLMAWTLSVNWEAELLRSILIARLGPELAAELEPLHLSRWPYVVPPGSESVHSALEGVRLARPFTGPSPYDGLGSNNWAISPQRSATGGAILANDMHLGLTAPAIWYENHIACPDFDATGVTLPGAPGIVSGHNGHVAWGFTNGFPDVQDLYLEKLRRTPEGGYQAEHNGEWEDVRLLRETIRVKGGADVVEEVVITRHGPIINRLAPDLSGEQPLALRWTALDPDVMAHTLFSMLAAQSCADLHAALQTWSCPPQHVVYADIHGDIAYTFAGKIPLRSRGSGRLPSPGWTDEYEWTGYIPFTALPHLVNPPQGFIASANNRAVCADYPLRLDLEPISGDRAQRICELILDAGLRGGRETLDLEFVQRMQYDLLSPSARLVARFINALNPAHSAHTPKSDLRTALELFAGWDGELRPDSAAAVVYEAAIRCLARLLLSARLEDHPLLSNSRRKPQTTLTERVMGKGPTPVLAEAGLFGERWLPWLTDLLADADSHWFDLGAGQTRDDLLLQALQAALDELKPRLGPDLHAWRWGALHQASFRHSLAVSPVLAALFNVGPFAIGGDSTTVCATGASYYNLETEAMIAAPYRMIVDLADPDRSLSLLAPGQSGRPASPYYADQVQDWLAGRYHPMAYSREAVERATRHTLRLAP